MSVWQVLWGSRRVKMKNMMIKLQRHIPVMILTNDGTVSQLGEDGNISVRGHVHKKSLEQKSICPKTTCYKSWGKSVVAPIMSLMGRLTKSGIWRFLFKQMVMTIVRLQSKIIKYVVVPNTNAGQMHVLDPRSAQLVLQKEQIH